MNENLLHITQRRVFDSDYRVDEKVVLERYVGQNIQV